MLEFGLLEYACNIFSTPEEAEAARAGAEESLRLLHMHKHKLHGLGGRPGRRARPPSDEAARGRIIRAVETIKRAEGLSEKKRARDEREWALRRGSGQALRRGSGEASSGAG